jgi:hypothetical protein
VPVVVVVVVWVEREWIICYYFAPSHSLSSFSDFVMLDQMRSSWRTRSVSFSSLITSSAAIDTAQAKGLPP